MRTNHCDQCDFVSKTAKDLEEHKLAIHLQRKIDCSKCDFTTSWLRDYKKHMKTIHFVRKERTVTYFCEQCKYSTKSKSHLSRHMEIHYKSEILCSLCEFSSTNKTTLNAHFRKAHTDTDYYCENCPYKTKFKSHLKRHIGTCKRKTKQDNQ